MSWQAQWRLVQKLSCDFGSFFPDSNSMGLYTLLRRLGAIGSTAPSLGGGVPVSGSCLGGVSVCLGHPRSKLSRVVNGSGNSIVEWLVRLVHCVSI